MEQEYSEEEGGETYIDPNDLNIITNDYNWEPLDEDIINYARQLGFDVENDPQEFLEIAYNYLKKPLPKGWKRAFQKANGELLYIDMSTNEIHLSTQLEELAKEEYLMNKKEYEQRQRAEEEAKKKVTVIPRTKIPPIGGTKPKENQNQLKEKEFIQKLAKEKQKEDLIKQKEEIEVIKSQIEGKKNDNEDNTEDIISNIPISIADNNPKDISIDKDKANKLLKSDEFDINYRGKHGFVYQPEVYEDLNVQNKYKQKNSNKSTPDKKNPNSNVSQSPNRYATPERINKKQKENIPVIISHQKSSSPLIEKEKEKIKEKEKKEEEKESDQVNIIEEPKIDYTYQKQEYLDQIKEKLKQYKQKLKMDYEAFERNLDQSYNEKYEQAFLKEKRSLKDKFNSKNDITALNTHYEETFLQEIEDYRQSMKRLASSRNNEKDYFEKWERDLNELRRKKEDLVNSIQIQKENNKIQRDRRIKSMREQIHKEKFISDERMKIQKDSLFQKSIANISTIEMKYDNQLRQQRNNVNASQSISYGKFIKTPATTIDQKQYDSILQEHEKYLDELFQIKKQEIQKEFLKNREKELEEQRHMSLNETQDKISLVNREINDLEKDYYNELNTIRSKAKMIKDKNAKLAREQLNGLSNSFDQLKNIQSSLLDIKIKEIVNLIQESIRLSEGNNILYSAESKCEENLILKIGEANVIYQKSKTIYILTEKDFKQKNILLMYFYDIANYLSKRLIERPSISQTQENGFEEISKEKTEEFIKALFDYGKAAMNKYQTKYIASHKTALFPLIDNFNIDTRNAMPQNTFTQLMFQDTQIQSHQFRNEYEITGTFEHRDIRQEENLPQYQYSTEKREWNNDPISTRVLPISTYREHTERYNNNIGLSQHDIIKENEENQANLTSQYIRKNNQNTVETTNLSKSMHEIQSNSINKQELFFQNQKYQPNDQIKQPLTSMEKSIMFNSYYNNCDPIPIPSIPEDIKAKLSDEDFLLYSKINDFLQDEETTLLKQETDINNKRAVFDELTQFNEKGFLLQISHDIFREKINILKFEKEYKDKVNQYNLIKKFINNTFNFIVSNSTRTNFIKDKLLLIIKHIEEYYNNNQKESKRLQIIQSPTNQENYDQPDPNSVCICNSKSSNSLFRKSPPSEPINIGTIHNQFTNFYSLYRPNTLSHKINTNFSHEFFNFKKNTEYVNYKLASTRYSGLNDLSKRHHYFI